MGMRDAHRLDIHALGEAMAAAGDPQAACQAAVDHLARHPDYKPSAYLNRGGRLRCQALRTYRQAFDGIPHTAGMIGRAFSTGRLCVSLDVAEDPDYLEISAGVRAEICAPILVAGCAVGVVSVESLRPLDEAAVEVVLACTAILSQRLGALGGGLTETPPQRLVRHATRLTDTQARGRLEREILIAAADTVDMDSAALLGETGDGAVEVLDATGPLSLALGAVPAGALSTVADLVSSGTSCFTVGEPAGNDVKGLGDLRAAGAAAVVVLGLSVVPHRVLLVADRNPRAITTDMIELLELLCAHGASALRVSDLVNDLRVQATTDPLTGLGHHRSFHQRLESLAALAPVALLVIDLDGFKAVNDTRGHDAGDRLLHAVAAVLRDVVRAGDDVFRIGGDEFAVLAPAREPVEARALADRVVAAIRTRTTVTASVGAAVSGGHETLTETLLRADRALYDAKARGRDAAVLAPAS